jgi:hypothetical protein
MAPPVERSVTPTHDRPLSEPHSCRLGENAHHPRSTLWP